MDMGVSTSRGGAKLRPLVDGSYAERDTAAMDFKRLSEQVKRLVDRRGGTKALKEDADELRDIARGEGSVSDKAKAAADALKDPGAPGPEPQSEPRSAPQEQEPTTPAP